MKVKEQVKAEPHKFLFEAPEIVEVKSQKPQLNKPYWPYPVTKTESASTTKLRVCRMDSIYANEVNSGTLKVPEKLTILYDLPPRPDEKDLKEYIRKWEISGFGTGAVVTRRYQNEFAFKYHSNWGIILSKNEYPNSPDFAPFMVRWFNPLQGNKRWEYEKCWAEDLIVIHQCLSDQLIIDICEAQDALAT